MSGVLDRIASVLTWVCLGLCVWTLTVDSAAIAAKTSAAAIITAVVVLIIRAKE